VQDLQNRLQELPKDLEDLYHVIIDRIPPNYLFMAGRILRLVRTATTDGYNLSALGFSFALEFRDGSFNTRRHPLQDFELEDRLTDIDGYIKSKCMGLIELYVFQGSPLHSDFLLEVDCPRYQEKYYRTRVRFLHRSLNEYLDETKPWTVLKYSQDTHDFYGFEALFYSAVLRLLTCPTTPPYAVDWFFSSVYSLVVYAMLRFQHAKRHTGKPYIDILHLIDNFMDLYYNKWKSVVCTPQENDPDSFDSGRLAAELEKTFKSHWTQHLPNDDEKWAHVFPIASHIYAASITNPDSDIDKAESTENELAL
jgi:hypothetical protein